MGRASPLRRNREFQLLWSGQAASELGTRTAQLAYPLLVLAVTGSPAKAGLVGFAAGLPVFLFALPAGALVDRVDRRRLMLVCDGVRAVSVASLALALLEGRLVFAQIVVVAFVEGAMTVLAEPAERGALRQMVSREQIPTAIAQNEARVYGASLAGPPLGGFLFGVARFAPFFFDACSYVASFATLAAISTPFQEERRTAPAGLRHEVGEGLRWLATQPFLRAAVLLAGAGNFVSNGLGLVIIVLARSHGASAALIGAIFAIFAAGGLLGSVVAPSLQRRLSAPRAVIGYHVVYALLVPLLAVASPLGLGLLFGAMLFGAPVLNSIFGAYEVALVPDRLLGRVESANAIVTAGAGPLSRLIAGILLSSIGGTRTVVVFAAISAVVALLALGSRAIRRVPDLTALAAETGSHAP
jgi:predicted MFS family arabinose efflux permease